MEDSIERRQARSETRPLAQASRAPLEMEVLCSKLDVPAEFGERILSQLVKRGVIVRTAAVDW